MKFGKSLGAALAALLALPTVVLAAPPLLTGKYAFVSTTFCEAKLAVTKDSKGFVKDVTPTEGGLISTAIGFITFTPSGGEAPDGMATITGSTLIEGGSVRVGNNGFNWHQVGNNAPAAAYSFTGNSFTYSGQNYKMVFGSPEGAGYFRIVYMMRRSSGDGNPNCIETIWAHKQDTDIE